MNKLSGSRNLLTKAWKFAIESDSLLLCCGNPVDANRQSKSSQHSSFNKKNFHEGGSSSLAVFVRMKTDRIICFDDDRSCLIHFDEKYHNLLNKKASLLQFASDPHCGLTKDPPSKARRLSLQKLEAIKKEFSSLIDQIVRKPSFDPQNGWNIQDMW
ncbi:hypothetical protein TNIN_242091 [Trichonephila inaurata madagascariensis]|uniref:Uncharacterized protein n=1 Tax=Trichonephila inaurata madagascariensis TaxID=2747483 RepID=A0A8X6X0V1_9ARAC|nr:hypothetical protein TNIN_242091 [Trichonephila inaurata madagascariensis]